jgi:hypothetical protein
MSSTLIRKQVETGSCSLLSAHYAIHQHLVTAETITTWVESEEVLLADPRGTLTPAQMVDQKLLALLGSCPRSLHPRSQAVSNHEWSSRVPH